MKQLTVMSLCLITVCGTIYYFSFGIRRGKTSDLSDNVPTPSSTTPVNTYPHNAAGPQPPREVISQSDPSQPSEEKDIKSDRQISREIYEKAGELARKSKLADLKNSKLADGDKEIRIWKIPDLYSSRTKGYIFKSTSGSWKGKFIIDKKFNQHFEEINFEGPRSGWENWEIFVNTELSPAKIANSNSFLGGMDEPPVVIEVKFGRDYAKNIFWEPGSDEALLSKAYDQIKKEFIGDKLNWKDY